MFSRQPWCCRGLLCSRRVTSLHQSAAVPQTVCSQSAVGLFRLQSAVHRAFTLHICPAAREILPATRASRPIARASVEERATPVQSCAPRRFQQQPRCLEKLARSGPPPLSSAPRATHAYPVDFRRPLGIRRACWLQRRGLDCQKASLLVLASQPGRQTNRDGATGASPARRSGPYQSWSEYAPQTLTQIDIQAQTRGTQGCERMPVRIQRERERERESVCVCV